MTPKGSTAPRLRTTGIDYRVSEVWLIDDTKLKYLQSKTSWYEDIIKRGITFISIFWTNFIKSVNYKKVFYLISDDSKTKWSTDWSWVRVEEEVTFAWSNVLVVQPPEVRSKQNRKSWDLQIFASKQQTISSTSKSLQSVIFMYVNYRKLKP